MIDHHDYKQLQTLIYRVPPPHAVQILIWLDLAVFILEASER